jgi:NADPH:quinone reductase-like Zn-dependent oxidoreductase
VHDVVVQVHASGFVPTELAWPSTWTDRLDRTRTPSIPGHELAGVVTTLGYGTTGLSLGQRVFGLTEWYRDGTLAEYAAVEARNLAPLPEDVDYVDFVVESDRAQLNETVKRVRDGRRRTNIGNISALDDAVAAFNPTVRRQGKTIIRVRP